ncbi:hypothetical protein CHS0354_010414 [Potamilus streckersoni]|uniref:Glycosyltransferase n=1 Tax=Potamilus streckersoni TaxID=2493646 RepID=A0AAE0RQI3_9BIVA|nr:hypothetical protein CHS0354_010414 [Potamilus streckersoni]
MERKRAYSLDITRTSTNTMMRRNLCHIKKNAMAKLLFWCTGCCVFTYVLLSSKIIENMKSSAILITSREQLEEIEIVEDRTLEKYVKSVHREIIHIRRKQSVTNVPQDPNFVPEIKSSPNLLTLFSSWYESEEKILVHNNTIRNWLLLKPDVTLVIFTNDSKTGIVCNNHGLHIMPVRVANTGNVPVLKYMYLDAMANFNSQFYAFANSDILFTDGLINTLKYLLQSTNASKIPTLIVGRRTNVNVTNTKQFSTWQNVTFMAKTKGELFPAFGEDYFVASPSFPWKDIKDVIIGRKGYDNYLVAYARRNNIFVIDATQTILAVHQTTSAGNFESSKHTDKEHNKILLKETMKNIKYESGYTTCTEYYTDIKGNITVLDKRTTFPKYCDR